MLIESKVVRHYYRCVHSMLFSCTPFDALTISQFNSLLLITLGLAVSDKGHYFWDSAALC